MTFSSIELQGRTVKIIPMGVEHIEPLYKAGSDPLIWDYMPMRVQTLEDMHRLVKEALLNRDRGKEVPFVIFSTESNQIVGSTRFLDISKANSHLEIGWTWLSPKVWRTSVNTEAKYLLLRHSFESLGMIRVQLKTDSRNLRSQRAIERIGAVREGTLRKHRIMYDGYVRDSVYFSILDVEWISARHRLEMLMKEAQGLKGISEFEDAHSNGGTEERSKYNT